MLHSAQITGASKKLIIVPIHELNELSEAFS